MVFCGIPVPDIKKPSSSGENDGMRGRARTAGLKKSSPGLANAGKSVRFPQCDVDCDNLPWTSFRKKNSAHRRDARRKNTGIFSVRALASQGNVTVLCCTLHRCSLFLPAHEVSFILRQQSVSSAIASPTDCAFIILRKNFSVKRTEGNFFCFFRSFRAGNFGRDPVKPLQNAAAYVIIVPKIKGPERFGKDGV